ncbi:MAG: hypothetical protein ACI4IQ_05510 [Eubacterium sp.]
MKLEAITNKDVSIIKSNLIPQLVSHPLFMFYCPEKSRREKFINNFLDYYLYNWSKFGELYVSDTKSTVATLVNIHAFEYKFSGKNAMKMKVDRNSHRIFLHRETVENITAIIVPQTVETRILTLYGSVDNNPDEIKALVREIKEHSKEKNFAVVYETFSKRLLDFMSSEGFETSYQKQFLTTQFFQTLMTYNV